MNTAPAARSRYVTWLEGRDLQSVVGSSTRGLERGAEKVLRKNKKSRPMKTNRPAITNSFVHNKSVF
jgi:hypothetical protein